MFPPMTRAALFSAAVLALGLAASPSPAQRVTITETPSAAPRGAVSPADRDAARRHTDRGNALYNADQYGRAAAEYRLALRRDPASAEAHDDLADALYHLGAIDQAVLEYQAAIHLDQPDPAGPARHAALVADAYRRLGLIRQKKNQLISAVANFRASLRLEPDDALTHFNLGEALYGRDAYDSAAAEFAAAQRLDPHGEQVSRPGVYIELGRCFLASDRFAPAAAQFRKAVRLTPNDSAAHYDLGLALSYLDRYPEAIREFHEAARLDPRDADTHNALGDALYNSGDREGGRVEWRKVLRMGSADAADEARENLSKFP